MFTDLAQIFDFTFNPFALLSLLAILVNLSLVLLINLKGVKNEANSWFVLLLIAIVLWGISEFFDRSSASPLASLFWGYIGRPGWVFIPVILFSFALSFIGVRDALKSRIYQFLVFGPAFMFLFLSWNTNLISNNNISNTVKEAWGWTIVPVAPYFLLFIAWLEAYFFASVALLIRFYLRTTDEVRRRQTKFIVIAVLIPIIGGSLTDAILPILGVQVIPIAILLTSVMSIVVTYTIVRYSLFVINLTLTANTILDTMSEALLVIGPNHTIEQVNKATLDLLGFKKSDLEGQSIRRILPDLESWEGLLKRVIIPLKERKFIRGFEIDFITKDGKKIPTSFSGTSLVEKGHLLGIIGLARDIRETKKLINSLIAERNKLSVALGEIVDGVFAVDREGRIILFNPALERMLQIGEDEVLGKNANEVIFANEREKRILISDLLAKGSAHEDKVISVKNNVRMLKRDGSPIYVDLTSSTIAESEEINLGAIITAHDVSKEHDLEEMKIDFVSMAAHELRTPLTAIRGYLSVLREELQGKIDEEKVSFLDKAFISSSQLASLIENLLSVSRIERGRMKIEKNPVIWEELVSEIVMTYNDQARQKGISLTFIKYKEKIPKVLVDRFRMGEVLSNLIGNAINYTNPGGKVTVSTELRGDGVVTHVEDTGQGVPESAIPKLFTKFFRVSGVLEQGSKGTGLGLYISKAIVEMHNGRIWAKSVLGEGSTFSFSLPLGKSDSTHDQESQVAVQAESIVNPAPIQKRIFLKNGRKVS